MPNPNQSRVFIFGQLLQEYVCLKLYLSLFIAFLCCNTSFCQIKPVFLNYKDSLNKKQGLWITHGKNSYDKENTYFRHYVNDEQRTAWVYSKDYECITSKYTECCEEYYYKQTQIIDLRIEHFQDYISETTYFRNGRTSSILKKERPTLFGSVVILEKIEYDSIGYKLKEERLISSPKSDKMREDFLNSEHLINPKLYGLIHEKKQFRYSILIKKTFFATFLSKYEEDIIIPYGTWQYFSQRGELIKEEFYQYGKLIKTKEYK